MKDGKRRGNGPFVSKGKPGRDEGEIEEKGDISEFWRDSTLESGAIVFFAVENHLGFVFHLGEDDDFVLASRMEIEFHNVRANMLHLGWRPFDPVIGSKHQGRFSLTLLRRLTSFPVSVCVGVETVDRHSMLMIIIVIIFMHELVVRANQNLIGLIQIFVLRPPETFSLGKLNVIVTVLVLSDTFLLKLTPANVGPNVRLFSLFSRIPLLGWDFGLWIFETVRKHALCPLKADVRV